MSPCLSSLVAIAIYATGVLSLPAITGRPPTSTSSWHDNAVYGLFTGRHYQSTPLNPPHDRFGKSDGCDSGYTFIGPHLDVQALTIVDGYGQLVWMADRWGQIRDFRLQEYRGQDYITFWNAALGNVNETGTYYMVIDVLKQQWLNSELTTSPSSIHLTRRPMKSTLMAMSLQATLMDSKSSTILRS